MIDKTFTNPADSSVREMMHELVIASPRVRYQRIGRSILGRDINAYFFGEGGRRVVYFAAHHASESITCNLLFAFMHAFLNSEIPCGVDRELLFKRFTYVCVPCVNPDGIELRMHGPENSPLRDRQCAMTKDGYSTWQANARGVDLNHNYSAGFAEYKILEREMGVQAGRGLFSGEYPESEPECRAVMRLVRAIMPSGLISLHTQGEEIFYQPRCAASRRIAERMAKRSGYTVSTPSGTAQYGGLSDCTGTLGIPSFTVEAGRGINPLPETDLFRIFPRLAVMLALFPTML